MRSDCHKRDANTTRAKREAQDPVTTTKLRVVMQAAPTAGGVGAIQWVVPSIPG